MYTRQGSTIKEETREDYTIGSGSPLESSVYNISPDLLAHYPLPATIQSLNDGGLPANQTNLDSFAESTLLELSVANTNSFGDPFDTPAVVQEDQQRSAPVSISNPTNKTRRRKRTSNSECADDDVGSYGSPMLELEDMQNFGTPSKQHRTSYNTLLEDAGVMNSTSGSKSSRKQTGKQRNTELLEMVKECKKAPGFRSIHKDQSVGKMFKLELTSEPASILRPSYPKEGSRGALKNEDGGPVTIKLHSLNGSDNEQYQAVLCGGCVLNDGKNVVKHPHFSLNANTDEPNCEEILDAVPCVWIKKTVTLGETINVAMGIKRSASSSSRCDGGRTNKLTRTCQNVFRVYLLEKSVIPAGKHSWTVVGYAQVATNTVTCEQQQGPPSVFALSDSKCGFEGGITCTVKGKHLQCKKSASVVFRNKRTGWRANAKILDNVTSKENLSFKVPACTDKTYQFDESVLVEFLITIDKRAAENPTPFTYERNFGVRNEMESLNLDQLSPTGSLTTSTSTQYRDSPEMYYTQTFKQEVNHIDSYDFGFTYQQQCEQPTSPACATHWSNSPNNNQDDGNLSYEVPDVWPSQADQTFTQQMNQLTNEENVTSGTFGLTDNDIQFVMEFSELKSNVTN